MVIRDRTSSVEIALREMDAVGTQAAADLGIDVVATAVASAVGGPFTGRNDTVWIGRDEGAGLLKDLRELDRTRHVEAHVMAMSPAEFQLTIFATDRAGHVAAEGWVGREYAGRNAVANDRVCFSVQIEPSTLPQIVSQFEALAPAG